MSITLVLTVSLKLKIISPYLSKLFPIIVLYGLFYFHYNYAIMPAFLVALYAHFICVFAALTFAVFLVLNRQYGP